MEGAGWRGDLDALREPDAATWSDTATRSGDAPAGS
jgi:hypothetical protein